MIVLNPEWVWTGQELKTDCVVLIRSGKIVGVEPASRYPNVDEKLPGHIMLPGLVNAHSHAFQRAFRGRVQWRARAHDDFWSWREEMYRVAGSLSPKGVEAISRLAFLEMVESGITHVGEFHYLHHQKDGTPYADPDELARRVIAGALEIGLRITLLRVVYGRNGPGEPIQDRQRRFFDVNAAAALAATDRLRAIDDDRVTIGLAPHSVRATPPDWLPKLASFRGVVHAHVAEQPAEIAACRAEQGCAPLEALIRAGLVTDRFTAVHLTHPEPTDADRLAAVGAAVCVCPSTELDLGDGFLPVSVRKTTRLCVGSDSHAQIDLFHESRTLELHARALAGQRNVLAPIGERHGLASRLLRSASLEGGRSLGGSGRGLVPGAPADAIAVDLRRSAAIGVPPLEALAFIANPDWVTEVWVGGERVVHQGRHPRREEVWQAALSAIEGTR